MKNEVKRRIDILKTKKIQPISKMSLRGGMQDRIHRQEVLRHGANITRQKKKLKQRLVAIEREESREADFDRGFGAMSSQSVVQLEAFDEPTFRRIRSRRGFFNE